MSGISLGDNELIKKYSESEIFTHLSKTLIAEETRLLKTHPQLYAMGFNIGGRPDGLWFSKGSDWLKIARDLNNPRFPMCCYFYELTINPGAEIATIDTFEDFEQFDKKFPSYWINYDYFEVVFTDYLTGKKISQPRLYNLELDKLRKKGNNFKEILLNNNIIFTNPDDAAQMCKFYKFVDMPVERFKYKDWNVISKTHSGVLFNIWDISDERLMKYMWYQSLDVASGCIWDTSAISGLKLLCDKIDSGIWNHN
jgi:hypothetical protein